MIYDISERQFKDIMKEKFIQLPKTWDGGDFYSAVEDLFKKYKDVVRLAVGRKEMSDINSICQHILKSLDHYFNGNPVEAFSEIDKVMTILFERPIIIYEKNGWAEPFLSHRKPLHLFRIRNVQNNILYKRSDVFHTPYNLRSKVASCRYSIAGYPSLYLGTSLELCREESKTDHNKKLTLASRFEIVNDHLANGNKLIKVIELAIKPQDFLKNDEELFVGSNHDNMDSSFGRYFNELELSNKDVRSKYLLWYPLIAACSFIRANRSDPFTAEYIIPQLLMQWIRSKSNQNELLGIRYFSCASIKASDIGFNYVFPVSGEKYEGNSNFCSVLARAFKLTCPVFINDYKTIIQCAKAIKKDNDMQLIENL